MAAVSYTSMKQFADNPQRLGAGAFGIALKVVDRRNSKLVFVVKQVDINRLLEQATSEEDEERLRRMARNDALKLDHQNVVKVFCSFEENNLFCIVMEFCPKGSLKDAVVERKKQNLGYFDEPTICLWLAQLSMALLYMHNRKIMHRDVKSDNIFMMEDGTLKLGDFGIAKDIKNTKLMATTAIGTPSHMSPESISGQAYSFQHETWALGVVAYETITFTLPFGMDKLTNIFARGNAILKAKLESIPLDKFSKQLSDLVENNMLVRDPERRATMRQVTEHAALTAYVRRMKATERMAKANKTDMDKEELQRLTETIAELSEKLQMTENRLREKAKELDSIKRQNEFLESEVKRLQIVQSQPVASRSLPRGTLQASSSQPLHQAVVRVSSGPQQPAPFSQFSIQKPQLTAEEKEKLDKALYEAVEKGKNREAMKLMDEGATNRFRDAVGDTALHAAAFKGCLPVISRIIKMESTSVDCMNKYNETPLMDAAWSGNLEAVKLFVQNGASINVKDDSKRTAMKRAAEQNHKEIVDYLKQQGGKK